MSSNDKFGLGYGDYRYGSILSYENEALQSVFMNKAIDLEDTPVNDRFADETHATLADESDSKPSEYAYCESDSSVETSTSMPEVVKKASKVVCKPKVWIDAPIIEEYESDSDNDSVSNVQKEKETPSFAFTDSVKHVKTSRENIKETSTTNHSPKIKKQDRNVHTKKGLGYAFSRKSCFFCGKVISKVVLAFLSLSLATTSSAVLGGTTASSSSNTQNVAFVPTENTSITNNISTAYSVSSPSVLKSQKERSASYTDEVIHSFFANQSSAPQLDCDDLEQINDDDLEEMDLKWQVVMISIRIKKFHKRTGRKLQFDTRDTVGSDKTKSSLEALIPLMESLWYGSTTPYYG
nr:ribonuclease H-like domain-containing protein [Tanacetum cinerariifolium]